MKSLREADVAPVAEVAKKYGISDATIYGSRKRYGQLKTADVKRRLRHLELENARLKKVVADGDLELEIMEEINKKIVGACARRSQVAYAHAGRSGISPAKSLSVVVGGALGAALPVTLGDQGRTGSGAYARSLWVSSQSMLKLECLLSIILRCEKYWPGLGSVQDRRRQQVVRRRTRPTPRARRTSCTTYCSATISPRSGPPAVS